jgi:transposase
MQKVTREDIKSIYDLGPDAVIELLEQLITTNANLAQQVTDLKIRVQELENQLAQDSHNSSKPPSSDGFKKQTQSLRKPSNKKPGGQKGHRGNTLKRVNTPDKTVTCSVHTCTHCGHSLDHVPVADYDRRQVFDLPPVSIEVTEYQAEIKTCAHCQTVNKASFPEEVTQVAQYGARLKAQLIYLMNQHLIPYERTSEICFDLYGHRISVGALYRMNQCCADLLETPTTKIKEHIIASEVVNFDETGLRVEAHGHWLHSASTTDCTYYYVHQQRGPVAMAAAAILPHFSGTAVHDHWKPYLTYDCQHALCNAHHLRELTFIAEQEQQPWAQKMINLLIEIKHETDHAKACGAERIDAVIIKEFENRYHNILEDGLKLNPDYDLKRKKKKRTKAQNLLHRLKNFKEPTLAFMYDLKVPFDNNLAERDLRMMKLHQKISGCFRKKTGAEIFCRIRGYISTARKQNWNIYQAIQSVVQDNPWMPLLTTE